MLKSAAGTTKTFCTRRAQADQSLDTGSIPVVSTMKKALASASAFFSYIRLRRVILGFAQFYSLCELYCASRSFGGEYNITATAREQYNYAVRHNITAARPGPHESSLPRFMGIEQRRQYNFYSGIRPIFLFSTKSVLADG